ncbi:LysR family transcriptional regulator ArgP [Thalassococcus sp. S3]|uniref:LysR family transcriptional regulator ArgP n=1 Tax=Thalassococcus sp. S3 TaxID=2017482 RepID=UPI0010241119|nr:LysR family transcriptional regulator ArgP [Thalassococcus sp. S3]QBF32874.1 ArgP/LysG family DNA-binding transcriptional regulator [Thalassococcus sp. S3]
MRFDPHHLAALSAVLRNGSFDMAAAELNVTPSAISQRIKALEDRLGSALIRRGSPCQATPAGARLAKHAEDVGLLEAQVARDLSLDQAEGPAVMRIAVNADSLATWFVHAIAAVPDVLFDLVIDDQDHSADWLREGAVSAAITAHDKPVSGCDCHDLGALRYIATASPTFMQRWFALGITAKTLSRAPCLTFNAKDRLQHQWMAQITGERLSPPRHMLPSTHAFIDAARAGLGWGMNPEVLIHGPIRNKRLVPLVQEQPLDVALNWQVSRVMSTALAPVTKAVRSVARERLTQTR